LRDLGINAIEIMPVAEFSLDYSWGDNPSQPFSVESAPGIPMIFQGQEFLADGYFQDAVPLDWARLQAFSGINLLCCALIRLRRNWSNQTRGLLGQHINVHHVNNTGKIIAFHRWENGGPGDDVVIVANFAERAMTAKPSGYLGEGRWRVRFNSDWQGYCADFGNHPGLRSPHGQPAVSGQCGHRTVFRTDPVAKYVLISGITMVILTP